MLHETVTLTQKYSAPTLECFSVEHSRERDFENQRRDAVIVVPGGGYHFLSDRPIEMVALSYLGEGFNTFILRYGIKDQAAFPDPLIEISLAIKHVRDNCDRYFIDPDRIFIVGFSAGGHLAAAIGSLWSDSEIYEATGMKYGENRPTGTVLCYPVISGDPEIRHKNSFRFLTGADAAGLTEPDIELCHKYSIDEHISSLTVPAFIWSTVTDQIVPVENSLRMAAALQKNKIPYELHIFPTGPHSLFLANEITYGGTESYINKAAEAWFKLSVRWIRDLPDGKKTVEEQGSAT